LLKGIPEVTTANICLIKRLTTAINATLTGFPLDRNLSYNSFAALLCFIADQEAQ
jgi:hypothetical protein